jgi:hypothetical protein
LVGETDQAAGVSQRQDELATIAWIHLRIKIAVEGVNENALRPLALSPYVPISTHPPIRPLGVAFNWWTHLCVSGYLAIVALDPLRQVVRQFRSPPFILLHDAIP